MQPTLQHFFYLGTFFWFAFAREVEFPLLPTKDREERLGALERPEVRVRIEPQVPQGRSHFYLLLELQGLCRGVKCVRQHSIESLDTRHDDDDPVVAFACLDALHCRCLTRLSPMGPYLNDVRNWRRKGGTQKAA